MKPNFKEATTTTVGWLSSYSATLSNRRDARKEALYCSIDTAKYHGRYR